MSRPYRSKTTPMLCVFCLPVLGASLLLTSVPRTPPHIQADVPTPDGVMSFRERAWSLHPGLLGKDVVGTIGPPTSKTSTSQGQMWSYRRRRGTFIVEFVRGKVQRLEFAPFTPIAP